MIDWDTENWIQVCSIKENEICFTSEYLELTKSLGWGARKLASHLISHWDKKYENILDYFGPDDTEEDWYSGVDGDSMDIGELLAEQCEYSNITFENLDSEWYRDIMRAKLISLKLPKQLIEDYVKAAKQPKEVRYV